jgi:hypothetical protein
VTRKDTKSIQIIDQRFRWWVLSLHWLLHPVSWFKHKVLRQPIWRKANNSLSGPGPAAGPGHSEGTGSTPLEKR